MTDTTNPQKLSGNLVGAMWMLASVVLFTSTMTFVKLLGEEMDTFQIVFIRNTVGFLFILPFALKGGRTVFFPKRPWVLMTRVIAGNGSLFCSFYAVTHLAMATAIAIGFVRPLLLIFLAIIFLGEIIRWRRWTATAVGFIGVLVMVRPGIIDIELAVVIALVGSGLGAISHTCTKLLTRSERYLTMLVYPNFVGIFLFMAPALFYWQTPTVNQVILLIVMGVCMVLAQTCVLQAFAAGDATFVSPIQYIRLIGAVIIGLVLFGEVPDFMTMFGATIIIVATLYMAHRELTLRHDKKSDPPTPNIDI
jgi:drug/metabolite transporter (DMT)-like permease